MVPRCPHCGHCEHSLFQDGCPECPCGSPDSEAAIEARIAAAVAEEREACLAAVAKLHKDWDGWFDTDPAEVLNAAEQVIRARGEGQGR